MFNYNIIRLTYVVSNDYTTNNKAENKLISVFHKINIIFILKLNSLLS